MTLPNTPRRAGIPAAAWFAGQSFHGSTAHRAPTPPVADTRPRRDYLLPSGELVSIILDHDQTPRDAITYALKGGLVVTALLAPIQSSEIVLLLAHAMLRNDRRLRYLAAEALGTVRAGCEPLSPSERCAAVRICADELQMLRLMGVKIGGEV